MNWQKITKSGILESSARKLEGNPDEQFNNGQYNERYQGVIITRKLLKDLTEVVLITRMKYTFVRPVSEVPKFLLEVLSIIEV